MSFLHPAQRCATVLLLTVFACLAGAPLAGALSGTDQQLPACCRSAGAHHCAMKNAPQNAARSLSGSHCRAFPMHAAALLQPCATPPANQTLSVELAEHLLVTISALECFAEARRTRSPRGPPAPLPALS